MAAPSLNKSMAWNDVKAADTIEHDLRRSQLASYTRARGFLDGHATAVDQLYSNLTHLETELAQVRSLILTLVHIKNSSRFNPQSGMIEGLSLPELSQLIYLGADNPVMFTTRFDQLGILAGMVEQRAVQLRIWASKLHAAAEQSHPLTLPTTSMSPNSSSSPPQSSRSPSSAISPAATAASALPPLHPKTRFVMAVRPPLAMQTKNAVTAGGYRDRYRCARDLSNR